MSELTAIQKGAMLMARLLMHGPVRAADEAQRLGISPSSIYRLLNDLSALHEIPMTNDRGWWYIEYLNDTDFAHIRHMLPVLRDELEATPDGTAYCRPIRRRDVAILVRLMEGLTLDRCKETTRG